MFESILASKLSNIQKKYTDCEIGSYPYFNFTKKQGGVKGEEFNINNEIMNIYLGREMIYVAMIRHKGLEIVISN